MKAKKFTAMIAALSILFTLGVTHAFAEPSDESSAQVKLAPNIVSGNAVIAYCIDDGQFIYTARADEKVAPTVAAKLVACMVAYDMLSEHGLDPASTDITVTASAIDNAGNIFDIRVPVMGFKAGAVYKARDMFSAVLVGCANDAVCALASDLGDKYLSGGGISAFVGRMNEKAASLGLTATKFVNPTGLDSPMQYSTPREIALITAAFYKYDYLVALSNVEAFLMNGNTTVRNKNYLKCNYYVSGFLNRSAIGLIAGQLDKSGNYCLLTASQKDGRTYIFVVMCASGMIVTEKDGKFSYSFGDGNAYADMNELIDWTRNSLTLCTVATVNDAVAELAVTSGKVDHVLVVPSENIERLLPDGNVEKTVEVIFDESKVTRSEADGKVTYSLKAPVEKGVPVGKAIYSRDGNVIAEVTLVTKSAVESDSAKTALDTMHDILFSKTMSIIIKVLIGIIVAYFLFLAVTAILRTYRRLSGKKGGGTKKSPKKPRPSPKNDPMGDTKEF